MKKKILNHCMEVVKNKYPEYDEDKLEIINYGLESIYLTFTKIIIIFVLAIILNIWKEVLLLLAFYNLIRVSAFGMHAKKSIHCLIISLTLFIGGVYLCRYLVIPLILKVVLSIICIVLIAKYAPADTEKRPIINKKLRKKYKIISVIISGIFAISIVLLSDKSISNYLLLGMIEATIMLLPITYKIFDLPYDNYKTYLNEV